MKRYYITGRQLSAIPLLTHIERAVAAGVEYIQIREKDLAARALLELTRAAVMLAAGSSTKILVNDRADVALAANAQGVHLRSGAPPAHYFRSLLPFIAVSCHSISDVAAAQDSDLIVFGPVFDSPGKAPAHGLGALQEACSASRVPVFALGGVTFENADTCIAAGAAGIAGIRLFQA